MGTIRGHEASALHEFEGSCVVEGFPFGDELEHGMRALEVGGARRRSRCTWRRRRLPRVGRAHRDDEALDFVSDFLLGARRTTGRRSRAAEPLLELSSAADSTTATRTPTSAAR